MDQDKVIHLLYRRFFGEKVGEILYPDSVISQNNIKTVIIALLSYYTKSSYESACRYLSAFDPFLYYLLLAKDPSKIIDIKNLPFSYDQKVHLQYASYGKYIGSNLESMTVVRAYSNNMSFINYCKSKGIMYMANIECSIHAYWTYAVDNLREYLIAYYIKNVLPSAAAHPNFQNIYTMCNSALYSYLSVANVRHLGSTAAILHLAHKCDLTPEIDDLLVRYSHDLMVLTYAIRYSLKYRNTKFIQETAKYHLTYYTSKVRKVLCNNRKATIEYCAILEPASATRILKLFNKITKNDILMLCASNCNPETLYNIKTPVLSFADAGLIMCEVDSKYSEFVTKLCEQSII